MNWQRVLLLRLATMVAFPSEPPPAQAVPPPRPFYSGPGRSTKDLWLGNIRPEAGRTAAALRFQIGELLAATTAAAVLLALLRSLGMYGVSLAFLAAVAFTQFAYPRFNRASLARQEAMFDFVWGAVMPVLCLVFDPFVFKSSLNQVFLTSTWDVLSASQLHEWSLPAYAVLGWQIVCLVVSLIAARLPARLSALWAGMLWLGFALAVVVGLLLFLPAAGGSLVFIGLAGFTPLFTARAYYRRALRAGAVGVAELPEELAGRLALAGFYLACFIPGLAGCLGAAAMVISLWGK